MGLKKEFKKMEEKMESITKQLLSTKLELDQKISTNKVITQNLESVLNKTKQIVENLTSAVDALSDRCQQLEKNLQTDEIKIIDKQLSKLEDTISNIVLQINELQLAKEKTTNFVDNFNDWIADPYPIGDKGDDD